MSTSAKRVEELTLRMLDGDLSAAEEAELDRLLADPDAERVHMLLLEQEAALRGARGEIDLVEGTLARIDEQQASRVEGRVLRAIGSPERARWAGRRVMALAAAAALVLLICGAGYGWVTAADAAPEEVVVFALKRMEPGATSNLRALVRHGQTHAPYANVAVRFELRSPSGETVWAADGTTDADGFAQVDEAFPEGIAEDTYALWVRADRHDTVATRSVVLRRSYRIYLSTDKPRYQPGQTIHMRALALTSSGLKPAGDRELVLEVRDARGNKVHKVRLRTSAYGIAAGDFALADQINTGQWAVSASIDDTLSERSLVVERYVLPKIKVALQTEASVYAPGTMVRGSVDARYVFGEPVVKGSVVIAARDAGVPDEAAGTFETVTLTTDDDGHAAFTLPLKHSFVGLPDAGGDGRALVAAEVRDAAGLSHAAQVSLTISTASLAADVVVAGGRVALGLPNEAYVLTRYPDGKAARATGTVGGVPFETDESGVARVTLTPSAASVVLEADDGHGHQLARDVSLSPGAGFVMHTDRTVYRSGDSMTLALHGTGTVFVDAVQGGRTLWTRTVALTEGAAEIVFDIPADVQGTVHLRAHRMGAAGDVERADRLVVVGGGDGLRIATTFDRDSYRPGDLAKLRFEVTREGKPIAAALSLAAVDEAVFALSEARPGLEQAYFALQQELLEPKAAQYALAPERLFAPADASGLQPEARDRALGALLAMQKSPEDSLPIDAPDSYPTRMRAGALERDLRIGRLQFWALIVPSAGFGVLGVMLAAGALRLSRRRTRLLGQDDRERDAFARGLRGVVLAWLGGALLPIGLGVIFGVMAEETGLVFGLILGVATATGWLFRAIGRLRRTSTALAEPGLGRLLGLLFWGYPLAFLAMGCLVAAGLMDRGGRDALSAGIIGLLLGWALLSLFVAIAGDRIAGGGTRARGRWVIGMAALVSCAALASMAVVRSSQEVPSIALDARPQDAAPTTDAAEPTTLAERPESNLRNDRQSGPRVRSFFPETLLWQPQLITDERGAAELEIPLADSITTWRLSMSAVSAAGDLGGRDVALRVFQPFFVEPDLPTALTQDDAITVPVAVFNYLDTPQSVTVSLAHADWFASEGATTQTLKLAPREVGRAAFAIRARQPGEHRLRIDAAAADVADAVERVVRVEPNGERVEQVSSGELTRDAEHTIALPAENIAGSEDLVLKIYPGSFSQVVEGMEGIFQMPNGCFEQTSSVTYPSLLVLDYMRRTQQMSPELQLKAAGLVSLGYQRLLSFEVPGGGFEWFGRPPAHTVLTAYGLLELTDMQRVQEVDPAVIERTRAWLFSSQKSDGSWPTAQGGIAEGAINAQQGDELRTTAYIAWALAESESADPRLDRALEAVARGTDADDSYTLALVANALVAGEHAGAKEALEHLAARRIASDDGAHWTSKSQGVTYGRGDALDTETTALAAHALLRGKHDMALAEDALRWIVARRDPRGTWGSTQATILAMRALLAATGGSTIEGDASVVVSMDGEPVRTVKLSEDTSDVFHLVSLREPFRRGARKVSLALQGKGKIGYQLVATHYRRWSAAAPGDIQLGVAYDATQLSVGDILTATVTVTWRGKTPAAMTMVDLGIPPGFALDTSSLDALQQAGKIARYDLRGQQLSLYLRQLVASTELGYRLRASQPVRARTPPARAYQYYEPTVSADAVPVLLTVR